MVISSRITLKRGFLSNIRRLGVKMTYDRYWFLETLISITRIVIHLKRSLIKKSVRLEKKVL